MNRTTSKAGSKPPREQSKASGKKGAPSVANTPTQIYLDTFNKSKDCYADRKRIAEKCGDDKNSKEESKNAAKNARPTITKKLGEIAQSVKKSVGELDTVAKKAYGYQRNASNGWIEDHCHSLWLKPSAYNTDEFMAKLQKIKSALDQDVSNIIKQAGGVVLDKAKDAAVGYAEKAALREGASLASLAFPVLGEIIVGGMTLYNIVDGVWTAGKTAIETSKQAYAAYKQIGPLRDQLSKLEDVLSKKISPTELWADIMTGIAYLNPCLQARRCQLVPYNKTGARQQAKSGEGCCPGQTGHHLIPSEALKDCPEYTPAQSRNAPTVCVEGVNNTHGSHGIIHGKMDDLMKEHIRKHGDQITNDEAVDAAVKSHNETFKPPCDPRCLKAQLKSYYDKLCNGKMKPRGGKGTDIEEGDLNQSKKGSKKE